MEFEFEGVGATFLGLFVNVGIVVTGGSGVIGLIFGNENICGIGEVSKTRGTILRERAGAGGIKFRGIAAVFNVVAGLTLTNPLVTPRNEKTELKIAPQ